MKSRLASIDLLRFIAAMMVATYHWGLEFGGESYQKIYGLPIVGGLVENGAFGVSIFFVISGFVITGAARKYSALEFAFARANRLFPGLLVSMLIVLPVGNYFIQPYQKPASSFFNSVFLTYTVTGAQPLATQLWTLLVEIKFYAGIALLLLILPKLLQKTKGVILFLGIWQITILVLGEVSGEIVTFFLPYITLQGFSNLFALGICFNLLNNVKLTFSYDNLLVLLVNIYFLHQVFGFQPFSNTQFYLALASILIVFSNFLNFGARFQKVSYYLGLASYPIYLLHEHLGTMFALQIKARLTDNIYFITGGAAALITIFSIALALFIEKPLQKFFKSRFSRFTTKGRLQEFISQRRRN